MSRHMFLNRNMLFQWVFILTAALEIPIKVKFCPGNVIGFWDLEVLCHFSWDWCRMLSDCWWLSGSGAQNCGAGRICKDYLWYPHCHTQPPYLMGKLKPIEVFPYSSSISVTELGWELRIQPQSAWFTPASVSNTSRRLPSEHWRRPLLFPRASAGCCPSLTFWISASISSRPGNEEEARNNRRKEGGGRWP